MTIAARYVKRKQLSIYLDSEFLKKEKKSMDSYTQFQNSITANRKRLSSELSANSNSQASPPHQQTINNGGAAGDGVAVGSASKRSRISESSVRIHFKYLNILLIIKINPNKNNEIKKKKKKKIEKTFPSEEKYLKIFLMK